LVGLYSGAPAPLYMLCFFQGCICLQCHSAFINL